MNVSYLTVLEVLVKSLPLSVAALLVLKALGKQSATTRSKLLTYCFAVIALFPVCALLSPKLSLASNSVAVKPQAGIGGAGPAPVGRVHFGTTSQEPSVNWGLIGFLVWGGGVALCQLSLTKDLLAGHRRIKALQRCSRRVGIVVYTDREDWGPCVWGWCRPVVMIPSSMLSLDEPRRSALIAHELAHVERRDWLKKICFRAIRGIYWFNPFVWQLEKRAVLESEMACDDSVLRGAYDPTTYAEALIAVARSRRQYCRMAPGASGSFLSQRLLSLFNVQIERSQTNSGSSIAAAILVGSLGLILAPWTMQLPIAQPWALLHSSSPRPSQDISVSSDWVKVESGLFGPPSLNVLPAANGFYTVRYVTSNGAISAYGRNIEIHENGVHIIAAPLPAGVDPVRKASGLLHIGQFRSDIIGVLN